MTEYDFELSHFFAWARSKAYTEFERRLEADPELDPNWLFSDIMQELLEKYRAMPVEQRKESLKCEP
ncbi:MAG: hypothetical protein IPM66_00260 [Acidobacteriota bacterium]|nr:MAG: hypothetical protein IPM66_00260 [Acidobacteriota bacterium]